MVRALRTAVLSLLLAAMAGAALAGEYVVVASTDPAIARGQDVAAGQKLALAAGRTVTLMHASGALVVLKGAPGGAVAPQRAASGPDAQRMAVLKVLVSPDANVPPARYSRTRSMCPPPASLTTLDDIAQASRAGCQGEAAAALDASIERAAPGS